MKLIFAPASPFARKVRILIIELQLQQSVTLVDAGAVTPVSNNNDLNLINPLGMLPALELDNGDSLSDSPLICEYLNHLANGPFFPEDPDRRFQTLGLQALADGLLDIAVAMRYETAIRPEELRWETWINFQKEKMMRGLDKLENQCGSFEPSPLIGEITAACALGYLDFRYPGMNWRSGRSELAAWFDIVMQRESLIDTIPV